MTIDLRRSFWTHIEKLGSKNTTLFGRLRPMTSGNWGVSQATSMVIYKAVFLPRITHEAEIRASGTELSKSIENLNMNQR